MKDQKSSDVEEDKLRGLYWLLIVVFILWIISIFVIPIFFTTISERGSFGDSFGVINSLFSGLAFAGIIYTILLQRKELGLQREELTETKLELRRSANAQEKSERALTKQLSNMNEASLLNTYKTMIDFHNEQAKAKINNGELGKFDLIKAKFYARKIEDILLSINKDVMDKENQGL